MGKLVFPFLDQDGAFQQVGTERYLEEAWEDIALDSSLASWGRDMGEAKYAAFPICYTKSNQCRTTKGENEINTTLGIETP